MDTNATKAYLSNMRTSAALLKEINEALTEKVMAQAINGGPNDTTWADVGDAEHYRQQLSELADKVLQRGEYAPCG